MTHPEKCSAYINGKCTNGYPDHVTSRCGVCYGRDHGTRWAPCTSDKFAEIWYPETGTPLKELAAGRQAGAAMTHPEKRLAERYGIKDRSLVKKLTRTIKNRSPRAELVKMLPGHAAVFEIHARGRMLYPVFDLRRKCIKTFLPGKGV